MGVRGISFLDWTICLGDYSERTSGKRYESAHMGKSGGLFRAGRSEHHKVEDVVVLVAARRYLAAQPDLWEERAEEM